MEVYNNELYHYGVLGMKWGQHKTRTNVSTKSKKVSRQEKLIAISKSKNAHAKDVELAKTVTSSKGKRIAKSIANGVGNQIVSDILNDRSLNYAKLSKKELGQRAFGIARKSAQKYVEDSLKAAAMASRYDKKGNIIKGDKNSLFTREEKAAAGIKYASSAIGKYGIYKLGKMSMEKSRGKKLYESWGDNILKSTPFDASKYVNDVKFHVKK